jgi:hypothetical protein
MSIRRALLAASLALALPAAPAAAHSVSDAYLTLTAVGSGGAGPVVLHGEWDIALRDLDFVLGLDSDGDGELTWGEVRRHAPEIARYAYAALHLADGAGRACSLTPGRQLVDGHADGAYAVLTFDVTCPQPARRLALDYRLFFAVDPSHRGLLVLRSGADTATAVLSPETPHIELPL